MFQKIRDSVKEHIGIKLVIALSAWIAVLMVMGTLFVAKIMYEYQSGVLEARGREIGRFLSRAGVDPLITFDYTTLNGLVAEALQSPDVEYAFIADANGNIITTTRSSFSADRAEVRAFLEAEPGADMKRLAARAREVLGAFEVSTDLKTGDTRLGSVTLGLSRAGIRAMAVKIIGLLFGTSVVIIASISLLMYVLTRRMIVRPADHAKEAASRVAAGDLTQTVKVSSNDEIGELGRSLNRMIIGLKGMIENVRAAGGKLDTVASDVAGVSANMAGGSRVQSESVEEAASSVNEMHFSLKEIAESVENLKGTSEQTASTVIETAASVEEVARTMLDLSANVEETSSAITEMSAAIRQTAENVEALSAAAEQTAASASEIAASVREVERNAKDSASLAEAVSADAQQLGMRAIEKTISGMQRIEEETSSAAAVINRLGERAESIGGILTVIEDVTDQTGLLALNAAILAAQAGEHGKGFAVVAAEIRELANRTASSTKEISKLIVSVQEESRQAVEVMGKSVALVADGTGLARGAEAALRKILERAGQSRDMSRSISKAAAEQTAGMRQVNEAVDKINEMAHQIAKAVAEQRTGSEQIMRAADKMRDISRFVKNATQEQVKAGKSIAEAVDGMNGKVGMVSRASAEVRAGSDLIVKSIDRIKTAAKANAEMSFQLNMAVEVMTAQAATLKEEIGKFTT